MVNNDLYNFIVVAEELNITNAAAKLFISQQALSDQIKRLERQYGATFFERRPRLKLTPYGECMLSYARNVISQERQLQMNFDKLCNDRNFRIGYSGARAQLLISRAFHQLSEADPAIDYSLIASSSVTLPTMLENDDLDAYIVSCGEVPPDIEAAVLFRARFIWICKKELFSLHFDEEIFKKGTYEEKLMIASGIPTSVPPTGFPLRSTIDDLFLRHSLKPTYAYYTVSSSISIEICKNGKAAIFITEDMLNQYLKGDEISQYVSMSLTDIVELEPLKFVCKKNNKKGDPQKIIDILRMNALTDSVPFNK